LSSFYIQALPLKTYQICDTDFATVKNTRIKNVQPFWAVAVAQLAEWTIPTP